MSIAYKLFGVPKTLDEFLDKVKRKGYNKVNINLWSYDNDDGFGPFNYHTVVDIRAGKIKLKLNEYTYVRTWNLNDTIIGKAKIELAALNEAAETADKLKIHGLESTINNKSTDELKKEISKYAGEILEKEREFNK
ncbi:hypothetical protein J4461_03860 [Candidatus Pacearchaeota archaeon]|nr:hypothetical protein [Candidatus Pacearchaeota archaeon]HIJ13582.1 hypothetical protein [Candidatus Woesearchaeota archaeon]